MSATEHTGDVKNTLHAKVTLICNRIQSLENERETQKQEIEHYKIKIQDLTSKSEVHIKNIKTKYQEKIKTLSEHHAKSQKVAQSEVNLYKIKLDKLRIKAENERRMQNLRFQKEKEFLNDLIRLQKSQLDEMMSKYIAPMSILESKENIERSLEQECHCSNKQEKLCSSAARSIIENSQMHERTRSIYDAAASAGRKDSSNRLSTKSPAITKPKINPSWWFNMKSNVSRLSDIQEATTSISQEMNENRSPVIPLPSLPLRYKNGCTDPVRRPIYRRFNEANEQRLKGLQRKRRTHSKRLSVSFSRNRSDETPTSAGHINKKDRDEDSDEESDRDDEEAPPGSKVTKIRVSSIRFDTISKAGFGMSRSKIEEAFYKSKFRVNGNKILKKSKEMEVGDEIDMVLHQSVNNPGRLVVNRIVILSMNPVNDGIQVKLSADKNLLIEDYGDSYL